ncbi:hypothetical protein E4U41_007280 [Claviceps citrina]|nr:hypothetical protein E4U41_007280 [Claviceps citrina]
MSLHSREQLHKAAADVIILLKTIPEFQNSKIAVIGGLAVWKYLRGRTTEDVDFIVNIDSAPHGVKGKLLALENSPFIQRAQKFLYRSPDGDDIQIDITHQDSSPYFPEAAIKLKDVAKGEVPYISPIDLIVFKIFSCGMRAQIPKRNLDATDALNLVIHEAQRSKIRLSLEQRKLIEPYIMDVVEYGGMPEDWWRTQLGLEAGQE